MSYSKVSTRLSAGQKIIRAVIGLSLIGVNFGLLAVIPQEIAQAAPIQYYSVKTGNGKWVTATKKGGKYMTCGGEPIIGWLQASKSDGRTCGG